MKMTPTRHINVFTVVVICIAIINRNSIADGKYNINVRKRYRLITFSKKKAY